MSEKTKHTPVPWHNHDEMIHSQGVEDGKQIHHAVADTLDHSSVCPEQKIANANFIVLAVNVHYELLAACESAIPYLADMVRRAPVEPENETKMGDSMALKAMLAAIAKAKGSPPTTK